MRMEFLYNDVCTYFSVHSPKTKGKRLLHQILCEATGWRWWYDI